MRVTCTVEFYVPDEEARLVENGRWTDWSRAYLVAAVDSDTRIYEYTVHVEDADGTVIAEGSDRG
jgi:hypothetical protein